MGYFYATERKKFEVSFSEFRLACEAAGMREEDIEEMYIFDKAQFNRDRAYYTRIQTLESGASIEGDKVESDRSALMKKFVEQLSDCQAEISEWDRHSWVEDLDTPDLAFRVKALSPADREFLSKLVSDGLTRADLAREMNVSRAAITKKIARIKKNLTNG